MITRYRVCRRSGHKWMFQSMFQYRQIAEMFLRYHIRKGFKAVPFDVSAWRIQENVDGVWIVRNILVPFVHLDHPEKSYRGCVQLLPGELSGNPCEYVYPDPDIKLGY